MSPRTQEQFKEIREEKKAMIMATALEIFAEKSFLGASVSMIAKKAGVSKGLLYNYFESKEDLLQQIIFQTLDSFIELFDESKAESFDENDLAGLINFNFDLIKKDPHFWKLYVSLLVQPAAFKFIEAKLPEFIKAFTKILVTYYQKKGVKYPEAQARLLGAVLDGVSLNYILDPKGFPLEEIKQLLIEKFK